MKTDWTLVRDMMNAAIDTCARLEAAGYDEHARDRIADINGADIDGNGVSVYDLVTSAWTFPENMRYRIIRERHDAGTDAPYVPEAARIITAMAQAAAELIGAGAKPPAEADLRAMIDWYRNHAAPGLERALAAGRD